MEIIAFWAASAASDSHTTGHSAYLFTSLDAAPKRVALGLSGLPMAGLPFQDWCKKF